VCSLDTAIALLAGLAIFPALYTVSGLEPTEGASLIFVVLPNVFNQIPLGDLFGTGFFLLLAIAALTSSISILIVPVAYFEDEKGWSRKKAVLVSGTFAFVLGIPSALSFGGVGWLSNLFSLEDRTYGFLDMMNLLFGQYSLMIGSLLIALFVGWKWGIAGARLEIEQGNPAFKMKTVFAFLIRFLCPVAIASLLAYLVFVDPNAFA
ncbi:MAG: sodium-dependent transporter, partial [Bacteroidota bacterium]